MIMKSKSNVFFETVEVSSRFFKIFQMRMGNEPLIWKTWRKKKEKVSTTPGVPRRSPIQVLTRPDGAWLGRSDGMPYFHRGMVVPMHVRASWDHAAVLLLCSACVSHSWVACNVTSCFSQSQNILCLGAWLMKEPLNPETFLGVPHVLSYRTVILFFCCGLPG